MKNKKLPRPSKEDRDSLLFGVDLQEKTLALNAEERFSRMDLIFR